MGGHVWKKIGIGAGFVVAFLAVMVGCETFLNHQGATVQRYFEAVGSGNAAGACAILELSAQAKLELIEQASTCPEAVAKLHDSLTPGQRDSLMKDTISLSKSTSSGSSKTLTLGDNSRWHGRLLRF